MVRESEHLRFFHNLLLKNLAGIVSLPGGGAVATAHRFRYKTKEMKREMDLEEITEPSLKIRRYFRNFFAKVAPLVCMLIENSEFPRTFASSYGAAGDSARRGKCGFAHA